MSEPKDFWSKPHLQYVHKHMWMEEFEQKELDGTWWNSSIIFPYRHDQSDVPSVKFNLILKNISPFTVAPPL